MRKARDLLQRLTAVIPAPGPARHNITLTEDGRNLQLNLLVGNEWLPVVFGDNGDYDTPLDLMVAEIAELVNGEQLLAGTAVDSWEAGGLVDLITGAMGDES